jgi:hypothetical protein
MIEPTAESANRADPRPDFEPPTPADTAGVTLLSDRERFIQQIAELTPVVLTVVDLKMGHHAYISRDVVILHGYTLDEIAQMKDPSFELLHPEDVPRVKENFNRLQRATDARSTSVNTGYVTATASGDGCQVAVCPSRGTRTATWSTS